MSVLTDTEPEQIQIQSSCNSTYFFPDTAKHTNITVSQSDDFYSDVLFEQFV